MAARPPRERPSSDTSRSLREVAALLGGRVRAMRLARAWTLEEAAERMALDYRHIQRIERGVANVTLATLARVAAGFGVSVADLLALPVPEGSDDGSMTADSTCGVTRAAEREIEDHAADVRDADFLLRVIGAQLAEARRRKHMTQAAFATRAGMTLDKLRRIEMGRAKRLPVKLLARLAFTLGVAPAELFAQRALRRPRRGRPSQIHDHDRPVAYESSSSSSSSSSSP